VNLGVLAFGDSITNGGGELQWGVALQSWALWLARGLGLPYSGYAVDGATARHVVAEQIPRFERVTAHPHGRYDVGCLYIGANDVRSPDWDPAAYERDLAAALAWLGERCDRTLALTIPLDLGRPRAGAKVREANAIVERAGAGFVCDLSGLRARNHVMADRVHPTAFGQVAIAERALDVLDLPVRVRPSSLIAYETTRAGRLRGDLTYAYRYFKGALPRRSG
jgi:lysophospholipase L1-like esterase